MAINLTYNSDLLINSANVKAILIIRELMEFKKPENVALANG